MLNLFRNVFLAFYELVRFNKLYKLLNNYEFLNFFLVKYIKCLNFSMKNDKQPFQIFGKFQCSTLVKRENHKNKNSISGSLITLLKHIFFI
jgi:hypothetical protein